MDPYIGEIRIFAGNFAPVGWAFCNGATLTIRDNEALYALLGQTWGGDGSTNFKLPDLRGRLPIGQGTGPSLTARTLGQTGGQDSVQLTAAQMPAHNHSFNVTGNPATSITPQSTSTFAKVSDGDVFYAADTSAPTALASNVISTSGGGDPHLNQMPALSLNYIIALVGIFPVQP